jgi:hypothetical protein
MVAASSPRRSVPQTVVCRKVLSTTITASEVAVAAAKRAQAARRRVSQAFHDVHGPLAAPSTGWGISSS